MCVQQYLHVSVKHNSQSPPYSSYSENFLGLSVIQNFFNRVMINYKKNKTNTFTYTNVL